MNKRRTYPQNSGHHSLSFSTGDPPPSVSFPAFYAPDFSNHEFYEHLLKYMYLHLSFYGSKCLFLLFIVLLASKNDLIRKEATMYNEILIQKKK